MPDSPSGVSYSTAPTSGIGTTTGMTKPSNYCTLNPLAITNLPATPSNGNLETTGNRNSYGTIALPSSGKWYWEVTPTAGTDPMIGMAAYDSTTNSAILQTSVFYYINGNKYITGTGTSYGASYALNDVIGVAANIDAGTVTFYKNNSSQGAITFNAAGLFPASTTGGGSATYTFNFGQRQFSYAAPAGFSPLVDTLLPTPTIAKPNTVMDVALYTGNGSSQSITGLGFSPDLVWLKARSTTAWHEVFDSVRGTLKHIFTNDTAAESTLANTLTSFDSNGFTLGSDQGVNWNTVPFVAWTWDAGSSNATNTSGTITSTVRANTTAGFSVVTYTGTGSNATVGHGLGVAPELVIVKSRSNANDWAVYHKYNTSAPETDYLLLNSTAATADDNTYWNDTAPTSSLFSIGTNTDVNTSAYTYVAYCWAPVAGYSAFGSYAGNGSSDGPFVYTGFRPRWILTKTTNGLNHWNIYDAARNSYNVADAVLKPNGSGAETTLTGFDLLSNGFKARGTDSENNGSGDTFIYAAFAEAPFPYARAR